MARSSEPAPDRHAVEAIAVGARSFLETAWMPLRAHGRPGAPSLGMCRLTSAFLARALSETTGVRWTVRGGAPASEADAWDLRDGVPEGGMVDQDGMWRGHYWVEDLAGTLMVDLTADQFGWEPLNVREPGDPRYRANYLARAVRDHLKAAVIVPRQWLKAWRLENADPVPGPR